MRSTVSPYQRRAKADTTFARFIGNNGCKPVVLRTRPQGCFANARVANGNNPFGINTRLGLQVIQDSAHAPGPGTNGTPVVAARSIAQNGADARYASPADSRVQYPRNKPLPVHTPFQNGVDGPAPGLHAPCFFGSSIIDGNLPMALLIQRVDRAISASSVMQ